MSIKMFTPLWFGKQTHLLHDYFILTLSVSASLRGWRWWLFLSGTVSLMALSLPVRSDWPTAQKDLNSGSLQRFHKVINRGDSAVTLPVAEIPGFETSHPSDCFERQNNATRNEPISVQRPFKKVTEWEGIILEALFKGWICKVQP